MDIVVGLVFFIVILPLGFWVSPVLYRAWRWFPKFIQYAFMFPVAVVLGMIASYLGVAVFFREYLFSGSTSEDSILVLYIIPFLMPAMFVGTCSYFLLYLIPNYERKILKAFLLFYAIVMCFVWVWYLYLSISSDVPFVFAESLRPIGAVTAVIALLKNLDDFVGIKH